MEIPTKNNHMKSFTIIVYADPSGAWAKVKRDVLDGLRLADRISQSSFQRNHYVYLDYEQDLPLLCQRLNEHGTRVVFVEKHTDKDSRIRSYERYKPFNVVAIPETADTV
jgi:hypothetical protein